MKDRSSIAYCFRFLCGLMLVLVLGISIARASVTGSISGTVTDPTGAVVPGVTVVAVNTSTGVKQPTQTNNQGFYSLTQLAVGPYELDVEAKGFQAYRQVGLVLDVNAALRIDVALQLGTTTQAVNVSATTVHVDTTNTQMGEVIGSSKMDAVPLNGRSYTDLLALQPGVTPVATGEYKSFSASGNLDPGNLSVSGQEEDANGFMVNGGNVEEHMNNGTAIIPNLDSIAEFRILTNNVDAEYGNYTGGLISVITKSGSNAFHGGAFEFLRNSDMDSRNFFSPSRGVLHQNQFGGDAGGPLLRNRVFFFADYQGTRLVVGADSGLVPLPSAADREGNLADVASSLTGSVTGANWASILTQQLGYPVTNGEPYYTSGCTTTAQCVLPNASISSTAFAGPVSHLLPYIPPTNDGSFFTSSAYPETNHDDKGSYRLDANTHLGMMTGYYFIDKYNLDNPYPYPVNVPGFDALNSGTAQMFNFADIKSFGASKVNELRLQFMRNQFNIAIPKGGLGPSLTSLGFVDGGSDGIINQAPVQGVMQQAFNSFAIGFSNDWRAYANNTYQVAENFSDVVGKHTLKFGGEFHKDQFNATCFGSPEGAFTFNGVETGDDFSDFLLGAPFNYNQAEQIPAHARAYYYALYAQDSWRATKNLTVNAGLRWDVASPWYEKNNVDLETAVPGKQSVVFPNAPLGWLVPGDPGIPPTIAPVDHHDFGPRLGVAYAPKASGGFWGKLLGGDKTSIRAAFGLFYMSYVGRGVPNENGQAPWGIFWNSTTYPEYTTPFIDRATGNVHEQPFPGTIPPITSSAQHPYSFFNWPSVEPLSGNNVFMTTNRPPYTEEYNFSLQRQFGTGTLLTVSYVGTQAHRLLAGLEMNPSNQAQCLALNQPGEVMPGTATCGPGSETGTFYPITGGSVVARHPFGPEFGGNGYFATMGNSNYNALEMVLRHHVGPLSLLAGYTYSKVLADSSGNGCCGLGDTIDPYDHALSKGLAAFDITNNFVTSYEYKLPFDKLWHANRLTSGWAVTGITRFSSGLPVHIVETDDNSLIGDSQLLDAPNYVPGNLNFTNPRKANPSAGTNPYFNNALFTKEALGQLGTSSHFFFHGPGINNWDIALTKDIRLTESKKLLIRMETFNTFNHAQFGGPQGNIDASTFGFVTSANPGRICQASAKFSF